MALIWGEEIANEYNEKIYVAVSKEWKACKSSLEWVLDNFKGKRICFVHVYQPAQYTAIFGVKFPISSLSEQEAIIHEEKIKQDTCKILDDCVDICTKARVQAEKLFVEKECIESGLVELISQHKIARLVMGAASDKHYSRKMTEPKSKKANYVRQYAPAFCQILFTCKGHLIYTRVGRKQSWLNDGDRNCRQAQVNSGLTQFTSELGNVDFEESFPRSSTFSLSQLSVFDQSSDGATDSTFDYTGTDDREPSFRSLTRLPKPVGEQNHLANSESRLTQYTSDYSNSPSKLDSEESFDRLSQLSSFYQSSVATPDSTFDHSGTEDREPEGKQHHLVSSNTLEGKMDDALYSQLEQALKEALIAKKQALEESMRRRKAEKDAIEAINKANAAESMYYEELRRRKELEKELATAKAKLKDRKY